MLVEFSSVADAVRFAVKNQESVAERNSALPAEKRIEFRVGINLGDVVVDGDDIHGDGVNVAARLEGIADPGGICVSDAVREQVKNRLEIDFEDMGEREVKNIDEPVRVWRWRKDGLAQTGAPANTKAAPILPDKPSIAVLPFQNMSGDMEQEYFADGIVEDIITELSRARWLFVIARNSSFTYKGRAVDVKQVGHELGVRYVLEGSVRKAGNRVRITGQLIDASNGAHLWADRFDGEIEDVFDLQDQVTASVVSAIAPKVEQAEIERSKRKPTDSLDAYDYYLRGMAGFHSYTKEGNDEALAMFARAMELDPEYATPFGMAARCYGQRMGFGWATDAEFEHAEALRLARIATNIGRDDAVALVGAGFVQVMFGDPTEGAAVLERALAVDPNHASAWHMSALAQTLVGRPEITIERAQHAIRLSPQDPQMFAMQGVLGYGHFCEHHYEDALAAAEASHHERPNFLLGAIVLAATNAALGRQADAKKAIVAVQRINPSLRLSDLPNMFNLKRAQDSELMRKSLRTAGLPE
jgi:adenylate cyclase